MKYMYTATFREKGGKVYARIPDLKGCITTGKNYEDAINQISDAASGWLVVAEDEGLDIPDATPQYKLITNEKLSYSLIYIDTVSYRAKTDNRSVRKNVSLPAWMAQMADRLGINCSQVLQEGLMAKFNI
ncbi:MAG: type II toxin-antitoxin system HicB family antitoxin [Lachnospiraceae bacterium]|nr:type II toxin-antitoxin system HicB family antitoxin [Lachnospiraceae bacterium]